MGHEAFRGRVLCSHLGYKRSKNISDSFSHNAEWRLAKYSNCSRRLKWSCGVNPISFSEKKKKGGWDKKSQIKNLTLAQEKSFVSFLVLQPLFSKSKLI